MYKKLLTILWSSLLLIGAMGAEAHCPTPYKFEKVCFMLEQNVILIYGENKEHNGPYIDLAQSTIDSIKQDGIQLKFSRVARGAYRIEGPKILKIIDVIVISKSGKSSIKNHLLLQSE